MEERECPPSGAQEKVGAAAVNGVWEQRAGWGRMRLSVSVSLSQDLLTHSSLFTDFTDSLCTHLSDLPSLHSAPHPSDPLSHPRQPLKLGALGNPQGSDATDTG